MKRLIVILVALMLSPCHAQEEPAAPAPQEAPAPPRDAPPPPEAAAPTQPSITTQATTPPQATLTWIDNAQTETGFVIEQKCGTQAAFAKVGTVGANVLTYVAPLDATLGGQTCTFRVAAVNASSQSEFSNEASCTIPVQALAAPSNLTAGTP
jgi:hypothetical protein